MAPKSQKALRSRPQKPKSTEKKKVVASRFFTLEDEIAILEGMIDSKSSIASRELLTFVKDKLSGECNYTQLYEKIRRLKEKFIKNTKHSYSLKGHDASLFDLSVQIWGKDEDADSESSQILGKDEVLDESNLLRNSPMEVAGEGEDSAKIKLREGVANLFKKYEAQLELARLDYEELMKE